jgi:hypothetical protein
VSFSALVELDFERFEKGLDEYDESFTSEVFRRAWFIAFRRLLLLEKIDRCAVDIYLNDLNAIQRCGVALRNARNDISRAENVTEEETERLRKIEKKALDDYRNAIAYASVSLSGAFES